MTQQMSFVIMKNDSELHYAVERNDTTEIERLLQSVRVDVNAKNIADRTPLHLAALENKGNSHQVAIYLLLKNGADVNAQDSQGRTALHYFVWASVSPVILDLFLKFNADINVKNKNRETPLFDSVRYGKVEMAQLLAERGANVTQYSDIDRSTPLHWACLKCDEKMIKCLVDNGADINALTFDGKTPLTYYVYFLDHKSNSSEGEKLEKEMLQFLLEFTDLTKNELNCYQGFKFLTTFSRMLITQQVAKLQTLNITVHPSYLDAIEKCTDTFYKQYLEKCSQELEYLKNTKLKNSWVSFFNLHIDNERKLKNFAGNQELVEDFNKTDCLKKFKIYGSLIEENMKKGIETRELYDKSATSFSNLCPIFNPTHLIIRDTLDCLNFEDYKIFVL